MAVKIDEARGDDGTLGVDRPLGRAVERADLDDAPVAHADIRPDRFAARTVDHEAAGDLQVERHAQAYQCAPW